MLKSKSGKYWSDGITLIDGCTPCSPGCDHCWSASLAHRFYREGEPGRESGLFTDASGRFNGDIMIHPERLQRFNTRKPRVFAIWNDLYHEAVPDDFIDDVIAITTLLPQHTFLLLSKRAARMNEYFNNKPLFSNNVYHGLTVVNQAEADEKIPIFLQIPGKKFLSIEPCLGNIYLTEGQSRCLGDVDAVILGCETGPGARPMDNEWAISVVQKCKSAGVPVFVKQIQINGKPNKNIDEWPEELRVRELPWGR
jgi:protein gp37